MTLDANGLPIPQEDEECTPERLEEIKSILLAIYLEHSPEKVSKIDRLLHKYNAREEEFLRFVRHKYGIPPPLPHPSIHHSSDINGMEGSLNPDGTNNSNATTVNGFPFGTVNSMHNGNQGGMYGGGTPSTLSHSGAGSVGSSSARHDSHGGISSDKDNQGGSNSNSEGDLDNNNRGGNTQQPRPPTSQKDRGNDNQNGGGQQGDRPGGAGSRFARSLSPPPMPQVTPLPCLCISTPLYILWEV